MSTIQLLFTCLILIYTVDSDYMHFITPSSTTQYAGESYLTLSTLVTNSSGYFSSNTTLVFLEGNHYFDSELVISNISGLLILSYNGLGTAAIICNNEASMEFFHITQLKISGLEFIRCSSKVEHVDQFTLEDSKFLGQNSNSALLLNYTNTRIIRSSFTANTVGTYQSLVGVLTNLRNYYDPFLDLQPNIQFYSARVGGALVVTSSTVTISTSCFESNAATIGGAIFLRMGSIIDINNCTFVNNSATGCSDDSCHGGALFIDSGCTVTVHNSTFTNNTAGYSGGAIALFQGTFLESTHNTYGFNRAGRLGGAISAFNKRRNIILYKFCYSRNGSSCKEITYYKVLHSYGNITVDNNFFNSNKAGLGGGVVSSYFSRSIIFINSSFNNSSAGIDGGVLYAMGNLSSIIVDGSFFANNTADRDGGVIHDIAYFKSSIVVIKSNFYHNKVGFNGGVLYALHGHGHCSITVINSSFEKNIADGNGGVFYASFSSSIAMGTCSFENNEAGRAGGVLYAKFSNSIRLVNSSFYNNVAGSFGGTMSVYSSHSITVGNSSFDHNRAESVGGVMYAYSCSSITMDNCSFDNNQADHSGGVMFIWFSRSYIRINVLLKNNCTFFNNMATEGGVVYVRKITFTDQGSTYYGNMASNGGVIILNQGLIQVTRSKFVNNTARSMGGVLYSTPLPHRDHTQIVKLENSYFTKNSAFSGGAIAILSNVAVTLVECNFTHNNAILGGAMYALTNNDLIANRSSFSQNSAKSDGGMIYSERRNRLTFNNCELNFNRANNSGGSVCLLFQSEINIAGESSFVGNQARSGGIIHARGSLVNTYSESLLMVNNSAIDTGGAIDMYVTNLSFFNGSMRLFQNQAHRGGALYASESRIDAYNESLLIINNTARDTGGAVCLSRVNLSFIYSNNTFVRNRAITGGAIYLNDGQLIFSGGNSILLENKAHDGGATYISKGKLIVETYSQIKICANSAIHHGGGLYLTISELKIKGENLHIVKNRANSNGGGIHATNSSLSIIGTVHFISNEAENGGGVSLEKSTKLRGIAAVNSTINFSKNKAKRYGGAMYIADETNPDMCVAVNIHSTTKFNECFSKSVFISVSNNSAGVSGPNLFGGLLDRCTVHKDTECQMNGLGIVSFLNSSNIDKSRLDTITSHPVRICFCRDGQPDCNYQPDSLQVNRGNIFSVELVAYDQVHHPVNASIQCSQNSSVGGLGEGQQIQNIEKACTELKYSLFTSNSNEGLTFSAVGGPCNNISEISERSIVIDIICSCPIGFQISNNDEILCDCVCDQVLQAYEKTECNQATKSIIRRENFWISYVNHTWPNLSGYVIYPHCPFDYCYTPDKSVSVNLNFPNGSDTQCDSNRTGTLCGSCIPGLCVSLGSSKCVPCPAYWPGLLVTITIVFITSGIGLVAFLLALNMTVAIGTLNAIIFYANVVAANKSVFFPSGVSPASVFISWLNFDLGFDICFFDGLNTYIKTWLQLAFPAYIIIIVVVIIKLSYYSSAFGNLIGKKDPVATLATLIFLSYAKLLQTIIKAFSLATLVYPDGSKRKLWLLDASVDYFTSKHFLLFLVAILILLVGLIYTLLLLSWQWLLRCPRKRVKRIRNQKLSLFMETYLAPYTPKHRYWTGLLLLVRVSVYLVSAFNPSGDPRVKLSFTACIISILVSYIAIFSITLYKNRFINAMEVFTYLNITVLTIFTWYTIDADKNKRIIINISVGTIFFQLIAIVAYHMCKHMNQKIFLAIQGFMIYTKSKMKLTQKRSNQHNLLPDDEDSHCYHELIDMIDYRASSTPITQRDEPTHSFVELTNSYQAPAMLPSTAAAINEETTLNSEQQTVTLAQDSILFETSSVDTKQCINDNAGIKTSECEECQGTAIKHTTIPKESFIPDIHSINSRNLD